MLPSEPPSFFIKLEADIDVFLVYITVIDACWHNSQFRGSTPRTFDNIPEALLSLRTWSPSDPLSILMKLGTDIYV